MTDRKTAPDIPPDAGHRATQDPRTGEVHGAGASAGGGNEGEEYDGDEHGGEGVPNPGHARGTSAQ